MEIGGAVGAHDVEAVCNDCHQAGADADGNIDIHGKGCDQTLGGGMRRLSRRRRGGCLTEAGAGGVDGPLDAVGESGADIPPNMALPLKALAQMVAMAPGDSRGIADPG